MHASSRVLLDPLIPPYPLIPASLNLHSSHLNLSSQPLISHTFSSHTPTHPLSSPLLITGLHGVFPIDAAVYYQNNLVAFVEIDGEFHYKQLGQVLRRKDRMKEFLYKRHYPNIPLFRIRSDQCTVIGVRRAGRELAVWISTLVLGAQGWSFVIAT